MLVRLIGTSHGAQWTSEPQPIELALVEVDKQRAVMTYVNRFPVTFNTPNAARLSVTAFWIMTPEDTPWAAGPLNPPCDVKPGDTMAFAATAITLHIKMDFPVLPNEVRPVALETLRELPSGTR